MLTKDQVRQAGKLSDGWPVYVYSQAVLATQARACLAMPSAFGCTVRYAMKANPHAAVLRVFSELGLCFDASSGFEAERALMAGIEPSRIQITGQELPRNLTQLLGAGIRFNACSIRQLKAFGEYCRARQLQPSSRVLAMRINPGFGAGGSNRTTTGGENASFGIWHAQLCDALRLAEHYELTIGTLHAHFGSGADPESWKRCAEVVLGYAREVQSVSTLSLGGGFKVARMPGEPSADMNEIGRFIKDAFLDFASGCGRELSLEIEPGTFLTANAGVLIALVEDVKSTKLRSLNGGHDFIVTNAGMTELMRPCLYGAQHPISVVAADPSRIPEEGEYIVVGHCCESGDIFTPVEGDPEFMQARRLSRPEPGDFVVISGAGAYGSAMACLNYNSFPQVMELLLDLEGRLHVIRDRQTLNQLTSGERVPEFL